MSARDDYDREQARAWALALAADVAEVARETARECREPDCDGGDCWRCEREVRDADGS